MSMWFDNLTGVLNQELVELWPSASVSYFKSSNSNSACGLSKQNNLMRSIIRRIDLVAWQIIKNRQRKFNYSTFVRRYYLVPRCGCKNVVASYILYNTNENFFDAISVHLILVAASVIDINVHNIVCILQRIQIHPAFLTSSFCIYSV